MGLFFLPKSKCLKSLVLLELKPKEPSLLLSPMEFNEDLSVKLSKDSKPKDTNWLESKPLFQLLNLPLNIADLSGKPFFPSLVSYFSSGPVIGMVWEGFDVIKGGRSLVGATNPKDALPGSIRGDLCIQVGRNVVHGSDSPASAAKEIALWFKPEEIASWTATIDQWVHEN